MIDIDLIHVICDLSSIGYIRAAQISLSIILVCGLLTWTLTKAQK